MKLTKEQKEELLKDNMKKMIVNTFDGKTSLYDLCFKVGVKNKVEYWNKIEVLLPVKERTIHNRTTIKDKVHDYGLIFNDDFQIRHVSKAIIKLFPLAETVKIRERIV